jgi:hypothetical protein
MDQAVVLVLWMLFAIEIKHFLCDFALQTQRQIAAKGVYGHPGGLSHAALHAIASVPVLLILTGRVVAIAGIVLAEFVIHYHTDWLKAQIDGRFRLTVQQRAYWIVFGADQLVHQLTYVGMILVIFRAGWERA